MSRRPTHSSGSFLCGCQRKLAFGGGGSQPLPVKAGTLSRACTSYTWYRRTSLRCRAVAAITGKGTCLMSRHGSSRLHAFCVNGLQQLVKRRWQARELQGGKAW